MTRRTVIEVVDFGGEDSFLSNFHSSPILVPSLLPESCGPWPTVEHAFQAAKTLSDGERLQVLKASTPGKAKRMGRKIALRDDWEDIKVNVMKHLVKAKFEQNLHLNQMLIALDEGNPQTHVTFTEGNNWHDQFWGQCNCPTHRNVEGRNELGKILFIYRENLLSFLR